MVEKIKNWLHKKNIPVRLVLAVMAGIIISKVLMIITHEILHLMDIFPALNEPMFNTELLWVALVFHSFYAVVGAYFTAQIARERASKAAFVLGTKEAVMWLIGIVLLWNHAPAWFNITKAVLGIPLAVFGGRIYKWHKNKQENNRLIKSTQT